MKHTHVQSLKISKGMQMKIAVKCHCTHTKTKLENLYVKNNCGEWEHSWTAGGNGCSTGILEDNFAMPNPLKMSTPRTQQPFS